MARWKIAYKVKKKGGLRVGRLDDWYRVLFVKWLWRFPWHRVIARIYGIQKQLGHNSGNRWRLDAHGKL